VSKRGMHVRGIGVDVWGACVKVLEMRRIGAGTQVW
jgi:hypothetical protein